MTMVLNESKVLKSAKIKNGVNITFVWPNVKLGGYFDFFVKYHNVYIIERTRGARAQNLG